MYRLEDSRAGGPAGTVDWWPEINAFIGTGITNARTEGYNRLVKQVKCAGCGFRNPTNSARRIRFHCTRKQRTATGLAADYPLKIEEPLTPETRFALWNSVKLPSDYMPDLRHPRHAVAGDQR